MKTAKRLGLFLTSLILLASTFAVIWSLNGNRSEVNFDTRKKAAEQAIGSNPQPRYNNPGQGLFQCHATDAIDESYIKGGAVIVFWGNLQPDGPNALNQSATSELINEIKKTGKNVYLHFMVYPSGHEIGKIYPQWLKLNDTDKINDQVGAIYLQTGWDPWPTPSYIIYPQPWDQNYQQYLKKFLALLNQAFEQAGITDKIEYIEPALGGQWGCTNLYFNNVNQLDPWIETAGCAAKDYSCLGRKFTAGVNKIVDIYAESFPQTALMMIGGTCLDPRCNYNDWDKVFEKYGMRVMRKNAGLGAEDLSCGLRLNEFQPFCINPSQPFTKCGQETRGAGVVCSGPYAFFNPNSTCGTSRSITDPVALYQQVYKESLKYEAPSYYCMYKNDLTCQAYKTTNKYVADHLGSQITLTNNGGFGTGPFIASQTLVNLTLTWINSGSAPLAAPLKQGFLPKWPVSSYKLFLEFETDSQIKDYLEFDINPPTQNWNFARQIPVETTFEFIIPASLGGTTPQSQIVYKVYGGLTDPNGEHQRFALINSDSNNDPTKRRYLLSDHFVVQNKGIPATPTPSPIPSSASLSFKIRVQGLTNQKPNQPVSLAFLQNSQIKYQQTVITQLNRQGVFLGQINGLAPGTYKTLIKAPYYLQRRFAQVPLVAGENTKDFTSKILLAGDFNDDNWLNIFDLALLLQEYVELETPINEQNQKFDVNFDRLIDIYDLVLVLQNYSELEVPGEN